VWAHVRAIETGRPVVRAANAGLSEVVDARGRAIAQGRAAGAPAVLAASIPRTVDTVYVRTGEVFLPACLLVIVGGMLSVLRRFRGGRTASRSCPS
jgi:apolipoprotein N-acyltransferase